MRKGAMFGRKVMDPLNRKYQEVEMRTVVVPTF
jgi:hypothetical protein